MSQFLETLSDRVWEDLNYLTNYSKDDLNTLTDKDKDDLVNALDNIPEAREKLLEDLYSIEDKVWVLHEHLNTKSYNDFEQEKDKLSLSGLWEYLNWLEDVEEIDSTTFTAEGKTFLVLDKFEADDHEEAYHKNLLQELILDQIPLHLQAYFNEDQYIEDAMSQSDRGSLLASYDSYEFEYFGPSEAYFVYRID